MAGPDGSTSRWRNRSSHPLRDALMFALGAVVLWLAVATAGSLHGGTGRSKALDGEERNVTATVTGPCHRQGPVSLNGLGFWWTCQATVGTAPVELRHSVATEADVGRRVRVHELCTGENHAKCKYGRDAGLGWAGLIDALHLIEYFVVPLLLLATFVDLRRYVRAVRTRKSQAATEG